MVRSFLRGSRFIAGPKRQWNRHCSVGNVNKHGFLEKQKQDMNSYVSVKVPTVFPLLVLLFIMITYDVRQMHVNL